MTENKNSIWIFGDYRNYFQNRVTLQLVARARELAENLKAQVCVVLFGYELDEWVGEYVAHGAHKVYVIDDPLLKGYQIETYSKLMADLSRQYKPEIILVGATGFGKELAARCASILKTGLTADCVDLFVDDQNRFIQTAPAFGGNLLADLAISETPQMATVRPGTFQELPHNDSRKAKIVKIPLPEGLRPERLELLSSEKLPHREQDLEKAKVVICGGRGMGSKKKFNNLHELARLIGAEVGGTRPVVHAKWAPENILVGQAGKHIKPKVLFSFGISGAIQHTAGISDVDFIVAVNKNPNAQIMQMADVAIQADANQVCLAMIRELKERLNKG